jgi:hypothetical protein
VTNVAAAVLAAGALLAVGRAAVSAPTASAALSAIAPAPGLAPAPADDVPLASPHAAAVRTPSAPNAWGGPRTGREPVLSDRVVRYDLEATLDPKKHTIAGKEKLTWRNRSDRPVKHLYLHLYLNAFEGPGSTFFTEQRQRGMKFRSDVEVKNGEWGHIALGKVAQGGAPVPWTFVHPDDGPATDHTVVRFDLPEAVPPGGTTAVDVDFEDQLPRVIARSGWFGAFHMVAQWFPKVGVLELAGERGATGPRWNVHEFHLHSEYYADFGEYDVKITVPKDYQVASAGEEMGAPVEHDGLTTHHFYQGDIHDFAWVASNDYAPPLVGSYDGPGSPHVTVKVFYPPEYAATAGPALKATIDSIGWFSRTLGPYPYKTSTCIVPPFNAREAGGMEYQTLFTSEGLADVRPDTINAAIVDFVTIHEFGHGYFYGLLASNEFEEPLLDEGLNEYWDGRMLQARRQEVHLTTPFFKGLGVDPRMTLFAFERLGAIDPHPGDPISENSWDRLSSTTYGQVYSRTTTVMHDLEERLGKEVIERGFRAYYARWHFRHPSIADLKESLAEAAPAAADKRVIDQVFDENVYGVHAVDDRIEGLISEEDTPLPGTTFKDGKWVESTREDVDKLIENKRAEWKKANPDAKHGGPFPFRTIVTVKRDGASVPETLVVKFADDSIETVRWEDDRAWRRFTFVKPVKATSAELDPERRVYLDINKLDDGRTLEPNPAASRRWASDLAALTEVFYSLVGNL